MALAGDSMVPCNASKEPLRLMTRAFGGSVVPVNRDWRASVLRVCVLANHRAPRFWLFR